MVQLYHRLDIVVYSIQIINAIQTFLINNIFYSTYLGSRHVSYHASTGALCFVFFF